MWWRVQHYSSSRLETTRITDGSDLCCPPTDPIVLVHMMQIGQVLSQGPALLGSDNWKVLAAGRDSGPHIVHKENNNNNN